MLDRLRTMTGGRQSRRISVDEDESPTEGAPLGGSKAEAMQRLQIGLFGLVSMVLVVGLANIIGTQADLTQERSVPDAAPTTEPTEAAPQRDPLADAGLVPDIPAEPTPAPTGEGAAPPPEAAAPPGNAAP